MNNIRIDDDDEDAHGLFLRESKLVSQLGPLFIHIKLKGVPKSWCNNHRV